MMLVVFGAIAAGGVCIVVAVADSTSISLWATLALVALTVVATHREAIYADETALSASVVVICACIVGLGGLSLLPPILCGAAAALHREHIRDCRLLKIFVNLTATVIPAVLATLVYRVFEAGSIAQLVGAVLALCVYWIFNNAIVGFALGLVHGQGPRCVSALIRSDTVMLVFGLAGVLCGVIMVEVGTWVGLATLIAVLVALDVFVISVPAGLVDVRASWVMVTTRAVSGVAAGVVGALVTRGVSVSVIGAFVGLAAGVAVGIAVVAMIVALRLLLNHGRADLPMIGGILVVESLVPIMGASSGMVASAAGLEAGLYFASAVVAIVSIVVAVRRGRAAVRPQIGDDDAVMVAVVEAMVDGLPVRDS